MTTTIEDDADLAPARVQMTIPELRRSERTARPPLEKTATPARLPRVTRLLALAIKYQGMVSHGELLDYADIARLGYITRARATQVMNLLHLAPDIQEQLIFADEHQNLAGITERDLRLVAAAVYWKEQRKLWNVMRHQHFVPRQRVRWRRAGAGAPFWYGVIRQATRPDQRRRLDLPDGQPGA